MKKKILKLFIIAITFYTLFGNIIVVNAADDVEFMQIDSRVSCGSGTLKNVPSIIPRISSSLYNTMMVLIPLVMIIMGLVDLIRGLMSQNEDEIKKGRSNFIKRLVTAVITFLIVLLVKFFVGAVSNDLQNRNRIVSCIDCFVSNQCES